MAQRTQMRLHAITGSLKLSVLCGWGYMLYKTSQGELVRLPLLSELADRSVAEQAAPGR